MYFIVIATILGIGVSLFFWGITIGIQNQNHSNTAEHLCEWGMGITLVAACLGFGLIPAMFDGYSETYYSKNFSFVKSPTAVYVEYPTESGDIKRLAPYNNIETYNNVKNMRLKVTKSWNYYGYKNGASVDLVK